MLKLPARAINNVVGTRFALKVKVDPNCKEYDDIFRMIWLLSTHAVRVNTTQDDHTYLLNPDFTCIDAENFFILYNKNDLSTIIFIHYNKRLRVPENILSEATVYDPVTACNISCYTIDLIDDDLRYSCFAKDGPTYKYPIDKMHQTIFALQNTITFYTEKHLTQEKRYISTLKNIKDPLALMQ